MTGRSRDDDDEDEENEGEVEGQTQQSPQVKYDVELPGTHSYLGQEMEEHSGRTVMEDESLQSIPLHTQSGVVLMPGEVLPLHIHQPHTISMMRTIIQTHRTFGVAHDLTVSRNDKSQKAIGVTAEIFSSKEEGDDFRMMSLKAMGRQRFEIVETWREATGVLIAKVRMLPEVWLTGALASGASKPQWAESSKPDRPSDVEETEATSMERNDSSPHVLIQSHVKSHFRKRLRRTRGGHSLAPDMTAWSPWVYNQYESSSVMAAIKRHLHSWDAANKMDNSPNDPVQFSFWVAGNLPVDDRLRLHLLSINCANQRLRAELAILNKCTKLQCRRCGTEITNTSEIFSMSKTGPQSAYVNPSGFVFETLTVYKVKKVSYMGYPNPEYSWFPGYAWTNITCRNCHNSLGWRFTVVKEKEGELTPSRFFGLTRRSLRPALDASALDLDEEDKKTRLAREAKEKEAVEE